MNDMIEIQNMRRWQWMLLWALAGWGVGDIIFDIILLSGILP